MGTCKCCYNISLPLPGRNICWVHKEEQQRRSIAADRTLAHEVSPDTCKTEKSYQGLAILSAFQHVCSGSNTSTKS